MVAPDYKCVVRICDYVLVVKICDDDMGVMVFGAPANASHVDD